MLTEKIAIVFICCATLCFITWCGTKTTTKKDKKDGTDNER